MSFRHFVKEHVEMIVSVVAVIMAGAAVAIAMVQTEVMREEVELEREHARLSVTPSAMLFYSNGIEDDGTNYFELNIINNGLGPAIIEDFSITYKGEKMQNQRHWVETVAGGRENLDAMDPRVSNSGAGAGVSIPAGGRLDPIRVKHQTFSETLRSAVNETRFELCFCSFYGDCFMAKGLGGRPAPVKACKAEKPDEDLSRN